MAGTIGGSPTSPGRAGNLTGFASLAVPIVGKIRF
jgi:hypothetical protein